MERKVAFASGEFYHLYNRGVEKRIVFQDQADYVRFIRLLYLANATVPYVHKLVKEKTLAEIERKQTLVSIGAYCLMPNHFHVLVRADNDTGISEFMKKLLTGYSMYFNKRYERVGAVFQGKFRAEHVDDDRYLKYLFAYIHLNPVKLIEPEWKECGIGDRSNAVRYLSEYRHSSYADFTSNRADDAKLILNKSAFPEYFQTPADFSEMVDFWLTFRKSN